MEETGEFSVTSDLEHVRSGAMATQIKMPQPGNSVGECLLARWLKSAGDSVARGEAIAEIESDKATFEIESPESGVLLDTFFKEGDVVPVHAPICTVGQRGEFSAARPAEPPIALPAGTAKSTAEGKAEVLPRTPSLPRKTVAQGGSPAEATPQTTGGPVSPRAARYAARHHVSLGHVPGSGPRGRILENDVIAARNRSEVGSELLPAGGEAPSRRRALIAQRMRESLAATAQFTLHSSADATVLRNLRGQFKEAHETEGRPDIHLNELLMFAVVKALQIVPELNATFQQGILFCSPNINLGFACDTPQGLVVPVIKKCQELALFELAAQAQNLAQASRTDALAPGDLQDGTFTVSNLGSYRIESFTPIIPLPQVAILGIDTLQLRPVRAGDQIQFREFIGFSLTCDHQVIDGASGAKFLSALREMVERLDRQVT